jgi:hypothetical protein
MLVLVLHAPAPAFYLIRNATSVSNLAGSGSWVGSVR